MIFFREVSYRLITQSRTHGKRCDTYRLKVKIEGKVSKLSGMIISLTEVDQGLAQVQKTVTEARNLASALKLILAFLKSKLAAEAIEVEISRGSHSLVLNAGGLSKKWRCYLLVEINKIVTSKKCQFFYRGKKPNLLLKPWKSPADFISGIKKSPNQISQVWIQNEKVQGFEIYHL